jgi:hypothetical protein
LLLLVFLVSIFSSPSFLFWLIDSLEFQTCSEHKCLHIHTRTQKGRYRLVLVRHSSGMLCVREI